MSNTQPPNDPHDAPRDQDVAEPVLLLDGEEMADDLNQEQRLERLREVIDDGGLAAVRRTLDSLHPAEIALLLESLPGGQRQLVWSVTGVEDRGEVLLHVNDEVRAALIDGMEDADVVAAARDLDIDDLADLVDDLPEAVTVQVLRTMDLADRRALEKVMSYDPDTAGGLTNTDIVTIRADVSVDTVLRYLRMRGELPEHTDVLYVVNRYGHYVGGLPLETLVTSDPATMVADAMLEEIEPLQVETSARDVAHRFENRDLLSAPVVDSNNLLIGRITIDDVVDVIRDQAEHDLMSMAGLDEEEDIFAPVIASSKRRAVWLGINLITAFLAAQVVGAFQGTIDQVVALAVLMPVVASMGGIGGSQTLTLMIRGMALGQIGGGNSAVLLRKELAVAGINGVLWAVVVAIVVLIWFGNPQLGMVIAAALIINQMFAALFGFLIPLILKKMDIDPALAGSVVLTTVTDVIGFLAFLGLGTIVLL